MQRILCIVCITFLLTGCGKKGPLIPPEALAPAAVSDLKLAQKGKILDVVTDVDPQLDRCLLKESGEVTLSEPPREDFWVQVNLAATL